MFELFLHSCDEGEIFNSFLPYIDAEYNCVVIERDKGGPEKYDKIYAFKKDLGQAHQQVKDFNGIHPYLRKRFVIPIIRKGRDIKLNLMQVLS